MIDAYLLRKDLIDYFGSAMTVYPAAIIELIKVENCSEEELISIAIDNGIDLSNYEINNYHTR